MEILKYQISLKHSGIKFHENTQVSNFMKTLNYKISLKHSGIKFHENTPVSNFIETLGYQISRKYSSTKFHENPSSGSRVVPYELTDERANVTKLIVGFRNFFYERV